VIEEQPVEKSDVENEKSIETVQETEVVPQEADEPTEQKQDELI